MCQNMYTDRETEFYKVDYPVVLGEIESGKYIEISAAECALKFGKI